MTDLQRPFYSSRMPLQSRNPNTITGAGSFNNSSTEGYDSKEIGLSKLECSGNENNKRLLTSASYSMRRQNSVPEVRDAPAGSAGSDVGPPLAPRPSATAQRSTSMPSFLAPPTVADSGATSAAPARVDSLPSSLPPPPTDEETLIIEEKRRRPNEEGFTLHRYLRGRLLGKGGFAKVYLCTALDTNKAYAIKIVPKANLVKARARQKLQAEIKIHRTLKHDNICEYKHFFEDRQNCYILLELCHNQSMNEMIKRRKRLTEAETAFFGIQILYAVKYLHENLVIHRDLKLGNLFLDRDMNIKVGDLGLATKLENADEKRKTICGTPNYIAPEVIQGDRATRGHSFEVDIWSMGVVLYTCMCGRPPYEAKDVKATYQRILANEYTFPSDANISDAAKDIIRSMLQSKPSDRPSLDEIAAHPFFTQQAIPRSIPTTATHVAPLWEANEYGELVSVSTKNPKLESAVVYNKSGLPKSTSARRPLGSRDVNIDQPVSISQKPAAKDGRGGGVVEGAIKSTLSALANMGGKSPPDTLSVASAAAPSFRVFDEYEALKRASTSGFKISQVTTTPANIRQAEDNIVKRTAALSLRSPRETMGSSTFGARPTTTKSSPISPEQDTLILQQMIERIDDVLEVTSRRSYSHVHPDSPSLTAFSRGGPQKWVSRYVDYTSKYGLGFLLNDGSSGVYFNDSTKTVLEADGESFQYIERKKSVTESTRRGEPIMTGHTLSAYPDHLQKKVTLLKHFRNYLMEQQKKADEEDIFSTSVSHQGRSSGQSSIYLKKWVRTKHAIFFRLSDHTVQIVFYDHTEILLTPDERHITYVDKERVRKTYYLTDELVGYNAEIAKRLKYTKEILHQLLTGAKN